MSAQSSARLPPSGTSCRRQPAGLGAGAPLSRIDGPTAALTLVAREMCESEAVLIGLVQSDVAAIPLVSEYLVDGGGKRLRPALSALGAKAAGVSSSPRLMCVPELIHLGSLLHDDVVDEAESRRGRQAAHRVFGNAVSVLTGDFCLARAVLLAAEEGGHAVAVALARAVTEMAEGEVLQLRMAGDLSTDRSGYFDVVERKSAALIAFAVSSHARSVGKEREASALEVYGRCVGTAFQITDDVLDYSKDTGKVQGADLMERKVTLPLLHAFDRIPGLRDQLVERPPTVEDLPALMAQIREVGALVAALEEAREFVSRGSAALEQLPSSDGRTALEVLGTYLVERVH